MITIAGRCTHNDVCGARGESLRNRISSTPMA